MNKDIILSMLLAGTVVFGSIALLSKSIKPLSDNPAKQSTEKQSIEPRPTYAPVEQSPKVAPETDEASQSGIYKCILAGKITYSEAQCPKGAKSTAVKIKDSEGIVSPDRETVNSTMRRIAAENKRNRVQEQNSSIASLEIRKKISPFCESYKRQIEQLDAQARQRNSSGATEIIRKSLWDIKKLQLDGNCYGNK